jgi:hypothetical protein
MQYKDSQVLQYEYTTAWALAKASQELLDLIEDAEKNVQQLLAKERGEGGDKFGIGRYEKNKDNVSENKDKEV